ncbi:MAG: hypothetical protein AAF921_16200 [Cyanobacteria bacterium P01_D01_bin.44]
MQPISEEGEPLTNTSPAQSVPISWQIIHANKIRELRLGSFSADGTQNLEEQTFDFSGGLPPELGAYCQMSDDLLTCTHLPTQAQAMEDYNFYLKVIPNGNQADAPNDNPIISQAQTVSIAPASPDIVSFTHNREDAVTVPKRIVKLQKNQPPIDITLSWEVRNATIVELLPAPGPVKAQSMAYPVSPTPGTETIILRAINEMGDEVTQSVVIEKIVKEQGELPPSPRPFPPPPTLAFPPPNPKPDIPSLLK